MRGDNVQVPRVVRNTSMHMTFGGLIVIDLEQSIVPDMHG